MREIEFRGKRLDTGDWVYGFYGYKEETKEHFIITETINKHCTSYFTEYPIDPATVGQDTGLRDKNGKKIYEGDIVKYHPEANSGTGRVVYLGSGFYVTDEFNGLLDDFAPIGIEVIGNVHDDKELLGVE